VSAGVVAAISFGGLGGVVLGYLCGRWVARKLSATSTSPRTVLTCAVVGWLVMVLPAFYLSFVLGGTIGGSWGEVGLGPLGVMVGLAVGICVVLSVGLSAGALFGSLIGAAVAPLRSPNNRWRGP
jgi:hypothetical protein